MLMLGSEWMNDSADRMTKNLRGLLAEAGYDTAVLGEIGA